ncbi:monooxygenase [Kitasatospora sp. NPDC005748]|uniref:FAD-dependent oxidoreductase n=1 Tax=Kitasatospora sp. NPDC005748 TaxID=3157063 RepID=UPI0034035161
MNSASRHPGPHPPARGHALVIGAGIAGLLCARVLSETFERVTLVERDHLRRDTRPRPGAPQGRHAHALQARGLQAFEELFPGLSQELTLAGAPPVDFCRDTRLQLPHGAPPPRTSGIRVQPVSRPLLEETVRRRVEDLDGVLTVDTRTVTGLIVPPTGLRVTGLRVERRSSRHARSNPAEELHADLVVDASGRGTHLPDWLTRLGLPGVPETVVDARVGYATRAYRTDPESAPAWRALFELPSPPHHPRGAVALRIEGDRLLVTLQGAGGDHPPTDAQGFESFLESLSSGLHGALRPLEPEPSVARYGRTANRRAHYHRLPRWPEGLVVLGDALCAFNPVYAQGMTIAALEAQALGQLLTSWPSESLDGLARQAQRRMARLTLWPWFLATLTDRGWADGRPPAHIRAGLRYLERWQRSVPHSPRLHRDLARVTNSLAGPATVLHPLHLAGILGPLPWVRRSRGTAPARE